MFYRNFHIVTRQKCPRIGVCSWNLCLTIIFEATMTQNKLVQSELLSEDSEFILLAQVL
jgi:hypothetical protein